MPHIPKESSKDKVCGNCHEDHKGNTYCNGASNLSFSTPKGTMEERFDAIVKQSMQSGQWNSDIIKDFIYQELQEQARGIVERIRSKKGKYGITDIRRMDFDTVIEDIAILIESND